MVKPDDFLVEEINCVNDSDISDLCRLLKVLTDGALIDERLLKGIISEPSTHLYAIRLDGRIIATSTLSLFTTPTGKKADIEDVVVLPEFQGRHLGRKLVDHMIEEARKSGVSKLRLTSRSSRVVANNLYSSIGFKRKDTNYYTFTIE